MRLLALALLLCPIVAQAAPATILVPTRYTFDVLVQRTEQAIKDAGMLLVAEASASKAAAARGVHIPGNAVLEVFRNDYAVRMLAASVPAGFEAPLRLYITENADGTATLAWRKPSDVFRPYGSKALDAMAAELDGVIGGIVTSATSGTP